MNGAPDFHVDPGPFRSWSRRVWRWGARRLGSYTGAALLLLFVTGGVLWGVWKLELTPSDTASAFCTAKEWSWRGASTDRYSIAFAPLYCAFLSVIQRFLSDAGNIITLHRVVIIAFTALVLLLILRRILPRVWAWLVAVWWVALPTDWRGMFEVHLFGFALIAAAGALAGASRSPWARGCALALLITAALGVRNEFMLAALLFGSCCGVAAWRSRNQTSLARQLIPLAAPCAAAGLFIVLLFSGNFSLLRWPVASAAFHMRTSRNLSQVYAFGYKQRHPEYPGDDPWHVDGRSLLERDFGSRYADFGSGLRANPRAMLEHFAFNLYLAPEGLQLGLFGAYSGHIPPDFGIVRPRGMRSPIVLSVITPMLWVAGVALLARWRKRFKRYWLAGSPSQWTWTFLLCCVPTCVIAILTNHPRPSYFFPLSFLLMSFTGLSGRLIAGACQKWAPIREVIPRAFFTKWMPAGVCACLLVTLPGRNWYPNAPQPFLTDYRRLVPFQKQMRFGVVCADCAFDKDLAHYLSVRGGEEVYNVVPWAPIASAMNAGKPLAEMLDEQDATFLYIKAPALELPSFQQWRASAETGGWTPLALVQNGRESWQLWSRTRPRKTTN